MFNVHIILALKVIISFGQDIPFEKRCCFIWHDLWHTWLPFHCVKAASKRSDENRGERSEDCHKDRKRWSNVQCNRRSPCEPLQLGLHACQREWLPAFRLVIASQQRFAYLLQNGLVCHDRFRFDKMGLFKRQKAGAWDVFKLALGKRQHKLPNQRQKIARRRIQTKSHAIIHTG